MNKVTVRWFDGYMEEFEATEVRFGSDLLFLRLSNGRNRHIPLRQVLGAYTVEDFARDNPHGVFVLSMPGRHVLTVVGGQYFDSWQSGGECPSYYWTKEH